MPDDWTHPGWASLQAREQAWSLPRRSRNWPENPGSGRETRCLTLSAAGCLWLLIAQKAGTSPIGANFSAQALNEAREQAACIGVSNPARAGRRNQPSITSSVTLCQVYSRLLSCRSGPGTHLSLTRCLNEKANEACQCSREDGHKDVGARAGLSIRDCVDDSTQGDY